ncbi:MULTISPECIES: ABC transporter ATP-binding protein [unclassified Streptomyces]|uniref:ABC transporter ATP-binding protein n=1 Tax=unclassified Streptomyces TaxID=2593676 RepID=UPI001392C6AF|nr:ATP-binding cassette domain-containing protein [Streptomyces sp. SID2131]
MSSSESTAAGAAVDTGRAGAVRLDGVTHRYGRGGEAFTAVGPVDLAVPAGEFLVLVGASGCGKSTLLRLIAGFERPTQGSVRVSGGEPRPGATAGVVFQTPRLFPWRTVRGNVDLALRYAGVDRGRWPERRAELLARVGLEGTENRRVWEISGGQQQRVAIARALAAENPLLLLDEPFAALDALTRERLQEDVRRVTGRTGRTTVLVTHSAEEAVFLGSRIVVLTKSPGTVALDLPIGLPRGDVDAEELRNSPEFTALRARVSHAVKAAAAA